MVTIDPGQEPPAATRGGNRNAPRAPQHASGQTDQRQPQHEGDHVPRVRTRRRQATVHENPFDIPVHEIPEGSSYEWKRFTCVGEEYPFYIAQMREQGWEPVNPKMHPNWLPPGYDKPHIIRDGLILMERPIELTQEARAEMYELATGQIREAEKRLGKASPGEMTRELTPPKVVKEYVRPIAIEE